MRIVALPRNGSVVLIVVALGLISGQPAGPIMSPAGARTKA